MILTPRLQIFHINYIDFPLEINNTLPRTTVRLKGLRRRTPKSDTPLTTFADTSWFFFYQIETNFVQRFDSESNSTLITLSTLYSCGLCRVPTNSVYVCSDCKRLSVSF